MTLRDYRAADFERICEIDRQCFPPGIAYTRDDIAMAVLQPGVTVVVAEDGGAIVGFVMIARRSHRRGHIITIDVLAANRRRGLGTQLMEEAHRRLRDRGVASVSLETALDNAAAIRFYEKLGYTTVRRLEGYYPNRLDAWEMAKEL